MVSTRKGHYRYATSISPAATSTLSPSSFKPIIPPKSKQFKIVPVQSPLKHLRSQTTFYQASLTSGSLHDDVDSSVGASVAPSTSSSH